MLKYGGFVRSQYLSLRPEGVHGGAEYHVLVPFLCWLPMKRCIIGLLCRFQGEEYPAEISAVPPRCKILEPGDS